MHITLGAVVCFSAGAWSVLCAGNNFLESLSQYPDSRKRRAVKAKTPKLSVPEFNKLVAASAGADVVPQRTVLVTGVSFCENPIPGKMDPKECVF